MVQSTATARAYIRRSVARRNDPGDVSREFQIDKVRALANGDGPTLSIIDADWGCSAAREHTEKRLAFLSLLEEIRAGSVSTLYAFSADRLARSVRWSAQLLDYCEDAGTTIVTTEGRFPPGDDGARMLFQMLAVMNENAVRGMTAKAKATAAVRKARGDNMGRKPYGAYPGEDPQHVIDVFTRVGSYLEAARALNAEGWPTRFVGAAWDPTTVRNVVRRHAPQLVPLRTRRGSKTRQARLFSGLLVCRCGHVLTQAPTQWGIRYYCRWGHHGTHPTPYMVAESKLLPLIRAEADRLRLPEKVIVEEQTTRQRDELDGRRERIIDMVEAGTITRAEAEPRLAAIADQLANIETTSMAVDVPRIDWEGWPAEEINRVLRTLFDRIELGETMLPKAFVWRLPPEYVA
jgi:DNA invertase Pin-like site-specific DNA recombinase